MGRRMGVNLFNFELIPKPGSLIMVKGKNTKIKVWAYHSSLLENGNVNISVQNTSSVSYKETEMSKGQAAVYLHRRFSEALSSQGKIKYYPFFSRDENLKKAGLTEKDIMLSFGVPETSLSFTDTKIVKVPHLIPTNQKFFRTNGLSYYHFAILTIYPPDSGYFATLKLKNGYIGLCLEHWLSLIPIWQETRIKTEIAIIVDFTCTGRMGRINDQYNYCGYTPLGVMSGFFNGNPEKFDADLMQKRLLKLSLFSDAQELVERDDNDVFGYAFDLATCSVIELDCRFNLGVDLL